MVKISKNRWSVPSGRVTREAPKAATAPYASSAVKPSNSTIATRVTDSESATSRLLETFLEGLSSYLVGPHLLEALTTAQQPELTAGLEHHLGRLRVGIVVDRRHRRAIRTRAAHHHEVADARTRNPPRRQRL